MAVDEQLSEYNGARLLPNILAMSISRLAKFRIPTNPGWRTFSVSRATGVPDLLCRRMR
jgi:hypothetical protein